MPRFQIGPASARGVRHRRRLIKAVKLWAGLTLSGIVIVSSLIVWGLARRARLIRGELGGSKSKTSFMDPLDY